MLIDSHCHLNYKGLVEDQANVLDRSRAAVAKLLGIPFDSFTQVALIPIAYTKGTDFKPAYRPPVESVMHINQWSS